MLQKMVVAVFVAFFLGGLISSTTESVPVAVIEILGFPGQLFMNSLKLLVLPIVIVSMVLSVVNLRGNLNRSKITKLTVGLYIFTTLLSSLLGTCLVSAIQPGNKVKQPAPSASGDEGPTVPSFSPLEALLNVFFNALPANIFAAANSYNVLGVLVFSLWFGFVLSSPPTDPNVVTDAKIAAVVDCFQVSHDVFLRMVTTVLGYAPLGVFSLVLARLAASTDFWGELSSLGLYVFTVMLGLGIHSAVTLPAIFVLATNKSPLPLIKASLPAYIFALGTGSSAATIPLSTSCSESYGVSPSIARFVIPLGATINMNGTSLYESVAAIFIGQVYGAQFDFVKILVVIFTAALAAAGAAAVPQAGLVTMVIVLNAAGLPLQGIGLILSVDWMLDRFRTVVNIMGDLYVSAIVDHYSKGEGSTYNTMHEEEALS